VREELKLLQEEREQKKRTEEARKMRRDVANPLR
jgi:hypothetical protein